MFGWFSHRIIVSILSLRRRLFFLFLRNHIHTAQCCFSSCFLLPTWRQYSQYPESIFKIIFFSFHPHTTINDILKRYTKIKRLRLLKMESWWWVLECFQENWLWWWTRIIDQSCSSWNQQIPTLKFFDLFFSHLLRIAILNVSTK